MAIRNGWRAGDYLVQDDLTGEQVYASQTVVDYRGNRTHRKNLHVRNPQDFVRPLKDGLPVTNARPRNQDTQLEYYDPYVGNTNIPAPQGAATHLFDLAIPNMVIGTSFIIR